VCSPLDSPPSARGVRSCRDEVLETEARSGARPAIAREFAVVHARLQECDCFVERADALTVWAWVGACAIEVDPL